MEWLTDYWHQILFFGVIIVNAIRAREQLSEARKDLDILQKRLFRLEEKDQHQQEMLVRMTAEVEVEKEQRRMIWQFINKLRETLYDTSRKN